MSARSFALKVVTAEGAQVDTEVESLVLPGHGGSLGVLVSHEPWTVLLKAGAIAYKRAGGQWESVAVAGGVAAIEGHRTLVLADTV